jgi:hypothetical protein
LLIETDHPPLDYYASFTQLAALADTEFGRRIAACTGLNRIATRIRGRSEQGARGAGAAMRDVPAYLRAVEAMCESLAPRRLNRLIQAGPRYRSPERLPPALKERGTCSTIDSP